MIDELIKRLPIALYSGGLYIQYEMNGLWYCGYQNSTYHVLEHDLEIALNSLITKLNENGYEI